MSLAGLEPAIFKMAQEVSLDTLQSEVAATLFHELGGSLGEQLSEKWGQSFWALSCVVQNDSPRNLQNSCELIRSKFHLCELLGFGGPIQLSAWGQS